MKRILYSLLIVGFMVGLASNASAALVPGVIPTGQTNEFTNNVTLGTGATIGGYYGGQLYLVGGTADITAAYYGGEAGYANQFLWDDVLKFTHVPPNDIAARVASPTVTTISSVSPGLLPFSFFVPDTGQTLSNGSNPENTGGEPSFFVSFDITKTNLGGDTFGQSVWIFLDDGGANNDDNHDDMLVKLSISNGGFSVPEPGTLLLLGSGLLGLAVAGRRRLRK